MPPNILTFTKRVQIRVAKCCWWPITSQDARYCSCCEGQLYPVTTARVPGSDQGCGCPQVGLCGARGVSLAPPKQHLSKEPRCLEMVTLIFGCPRPWACAEPPSLGFLQSRSSLLLPIPCCLRLIHSAPDREARFIGAGLYPLGRAVRLSPPLIRASLPLWEAAR